MIQKTSKGYVVKSESPYLDKDQWRKVLLALSIMTIALYIVAMVFSLCGSKYFILNYQNAQMDRINDTYFSPRFAIVGGIGSSEDTYYYVAWDLPVIG